MIRTVIISSGETKVDRKKVRNSLRPLNKKLDWCINMGDRKFNQSTNAKLIIENLGKTDTKIIGQIGKLIKPVVKKYTTAKSVMISDSVKIHIEKHKSQFDIDLAMKMLPEIINNPKFIYQGKKKNSFQFVEDYSERYFLLAPIKYLPHELWLQTLLIEEKKRFLRRWDKVMRLYSRE